jgi:hypothetical protein
LIGTINDFRPVCSQGLTSFAKSAHRIADGMKIEQPLTDEIAKKRRGGRRARLGNRARNIPRDDYLSSPDTLQESNVKSGGQ